MTIEHMKYIHKTSSTLKTYCAEELKI